MNNSDRIKAAHRKLVTLLKARRNADGHWEGRLSSSALSTAVAAFALWKYDAVAHDGLIKSALRWLADNANEDGGWGDTVRSRSNLPTTLLCWSAMVVTRGASTTAKQAAFVAMDDSQFKRTVDRAEKWLTRRIGSLESDDINRAVLAHYGEDRTFSVPILMMCAIAGRLGKGGWEIVPQLPFELALLPEWLFRALRLSVVSYAIPALIAVGLARHRNRPSRNPIMRLIRSLGAARVLRKLAVKQPSSGGFLEAAPLTAFVLMSMVAAGEGKHKVCERAAGFLAQTVRDDSSWPIDTNLATWVTTLSVRALEGELSDRDKAQIRSWLLKQQCGRVHPFTNAAPGGWAWTDLPGGVPDADDTAGSLRALGQLGSPVECLDAAERGITWLLDLQNSDGGMPAFCRGWGKLAFDRSCPDITAGALAALAEWKEHVHQSLHARIDRGISRGIAHLAAAQGPAGSWRPLWFGNEADGERANPVYGTSLVLRSLCELRSRGYERLDAMIDGGLMFLRAAQNGDHGWGGNRDLPSTIEETSLAVSALAAAGKRDLVVEGACWLADELEQTDDPSAAATPIGLYFASLWYFEELYPIIFASQALGKVGGSS